jgi:predicted  nucleic acid-binding Zn-ribbon protein
MWNSLTKPLIFAALCLPIFAPKIEAQANQQNRVQKAAPGQIEKAEADRAANEAELAMRLALTDLANQLALLTDEVKRLRQQTSRNSAIMELLLSEERLARLEDKIQDQSDRKAQLDAREQDIQRRLRNIQQELIYRGAIRREEAEAAIRSELQKSLEDVHSQQSAAQQRLTELQVQADRLRSRIAALRKRVEAGEDKENTKDEK